MAINLKAKQQLMYVGDDTKGTYRFVMSPEIYSRLNEGKVMREASMRSGIPQGTITAAWAAIGEVIKAWATEGHSVAIPGLGTMRFGVRATSVADVNEVDTGLITSRRVIFTPSVDIKNELKNTSINITCYDKDGNILKQTQANPDVEDENTSGGGTSGGDDTQLEDPLG
ncbi:MAG: DNA-binding protein [Mediterranea massiliensis]|nr:DNA-binding protein [Mediterranea massiliensis]